MRGRFVLALFFLVLSKPLFACPPPSVVIPSFGLTSQSCDGNSCSQTYSWGVPPGADTSTVYEILTGSVADYCSFPSLSYAVHTTTTGLSVTLTNLPANVAIGAYVRVQGCPNTSEFSTRNDTFLTPPAKPLTSAQVTGTGEVTVTYAQPDARAGAIVSIERSDNGGPFFELGFGAQPYGNYCPAGSQRTFVDRSVPPGSYRYRAVGFGNAANSYGLVPGDPASVVVPGASCTLQCSASVPSSVNAGQSVAFQATATPASGCTGSTSFSWTFGDGTTSSEQNPLKSYTNPGTYSWSLDVRIGSSEAPTTCQASGTITVAAVGTCTVSCTATVPTSATTGQPVTFQGAATPSTICTGSPSYTWDFGDGTHSTEQSPQKTYASAGTYSWSLNVRVGATAPATCVASGTMTVSAAETCTVGCSADVPAAATTGQTVTFAGTAVPSAICTDSPVYAWDFGDGTTSAEKSPRKAYTSAGSYRWGLRVTVGSVSCTTSGTITISTGCAAPSTPSIGGLPGSVASGRSISVSWSGTADSTVRYVLETSRDGFRTIETSQNSRSTAAVVNTQPSADDYTLSFRVKAVADCGSESAFSAVASLTVLRANATFLIVRSNLTLAGVVGLPPTPGSVTFRNIGAVAGNLSVSPPPEGFVTVSPASLTLEPGGEGTFTVTPAASALTSEALYQGLLTAGTEAVRVSLSVQKSLFYLEGVVLKPSAAAVSFSAPAGQNPAPQTITINLISDDPAAGSLNLVPSIGPGGAWLLVGSSSSGGAPPPIPTGSPITLRIDRSRRSKEEGVSPLRTLIRFTPVGGSLEDAAVVEVIDNETTTVTIGAGGRGGAGRAGQPLASPPGGTSFIVSTAVSATGATGSVFTSDGWLRNLGGSTTSADLFFTPDGKNGLTDSAVLQTSLSIPSGTTVRLSDLIGRLFQSAGTGQVEVRSSTPNALSLRTRVDSVTRGDPATRYGGEIPTVSFGSGTYTGGPELVVPGIDDDLTNRANLILTETSGAAVDVDVDVHDSSGANVGTTLPVSLAPYSKQQLDGIVNRASPGRKLSGGWVGVRVRGGAGHVVAVATVIDNRSDSFSAIQGKRTIPAAQRRPGLASRSALADPKVYVIPSAVRTVGANNTQFLTSLSLVNGTASLARLTLTYRYVDQDDGNVTKSVQKALTLNGRGSFSKAQGADVIRTFFGVTNRSFGYFTIEGDVGKVVGAAAISAQVDPNDASKGLRTAQVNGTFLDAPEVIGNGDVETRFAGAEKTVQKRTNLVLLELSGQPVDVMVRMVSPTGTVLAQRTVSVGSGQYFQINDVFGDQGVQLGDGPFQNMEVTAQVIQGTGKILAVATVNDNISRNPEIFILKAPGPGDSTIGF